tara:strand:- start:56794 stop:58584 length:1791 start_codon:yes stop_codon:yes gene_type:complete
MNEQRNFLLAIGLSILVLLVWQYYVGSQIENEQNQTILAEQELTPEETAISDVPLPQLDKTNEHLSKNNIAIPANAEANDQSIGSVAIDTDNIIGSISLMGGKIDNIRLKKFNQELDASSGLVKILSPIGSEKPYYVHNGWVGNQNIEVELPNEKSIWTNLSKNALTASSPVLLEWNNGNGLTFKKKIEVDNNFLFTITQSIENNTTKDYTFYPYSLASRHGLPDDYTDFFVLHEGFIGVLGDEGEIRADYNDIAKESESFENIEGGWLGFTDKNWATVIVPPKNMPYQGRFTSLSNGSIYQVDYLGNGQTVYASNIIEVTSHVFAGAKQVNILDSYEDNYGLIKFDLLVDWGWFYFLTKPLFYLLQWLYGILGNYGLSILGVTIIIKIIFFPLANKAYVSMSSMKKLQPEMLNIREKYKNDRAKQQQAIVEIYKKEKVNPLSGCVPILIQIPVFFALYKVLLCTMEMRHQPFFGWVRDLSAQDPTSLFNLFGLIPWTPPSIFMIGVWPIIMGLTMSIQMRLNPAPTDPIQQKIFGWMPVVLTFLFAQFSAGLVIYWAWNNTLSSLQQYIIMKRMGVEVELWSNIKNTFKKKNTKD